MLSRETLANLGIERERGPVLSFAAMHEALRADPNYQQKSQARHRAPDSKTQGYKHMRMLHDPDYDTIDDIDTSEVQSLHDLYELIVGPAMRQQNVCGVLITGPFDPQGPQSGTWGADSVHFPGYDELWWLRSYPKGRAGRPVQRDEVRKLVVLARPSAHSREARLTIVKLWLQPPMDSVHINTKRHHNTYGAHGVNMTALHLFEHQGAELLKKNNFQPGRGDYHAVLGSYISVVAPKTEEEARMPEAVFDSEVGHVVLSIHPGTAHSMVVAASLGGFAVPDEPNRPGVQRLEPIVYDMTRARQTSYFAQALSCHHIKRGILIGDLLPPDDEDEEAFGNEIAARLVAAAEGVHEQLSYSGMLDLLADPVFNGALPNAVTEPSGLPLLIALAVRIACYPERVNLKPGSADDAWATREAVCLYESIMPAPLPELEDELEAPAGAPTPPAGNVWTRATSSPRYAVDLVLECAISKLTREIALLKSGGKSRIEPAAVRDRDRDRDRQRERQRELETSAIVEASMSRTLEMMYRAGVSLCIDVLGVAPRRENGCSSVYNGEGLAEGCCDPVEHSRYASAYRAGLGELAPRVDPMRCTARGERQMALARVICNVERWLCTGTYAGARHVPSAPPASAISNVIERARVERDEEGGLAGLSDLCAGCNASPCECKSKVNEALSRCFSPAALSQSADEVVEAAAAVAEVLDVAAEVAAERTQAKARAKDAAGGGGGSSKKKKKARAAAAAAAAAPAAAEAAGGDPGHEDVLLRNTAASRGRGRRAVEDAYLIDKAVESLQRKRSARNQRLIDEACRSKLNGHALEDASVVFGEVMQIGACYGTSTFVDFEAFLVGPGSTNKCANCHRSVDVVANMAFGGRYNACLVCNHPRCLHCVQEDIDALRSQGEDEGPAVPPHRFVHGCLFCRDASAA